MPRLAYLTSEYPTVSHTFILREVAALRALGLEVDTCSVRRTAPAQHPGPAERDEAARTFTILPEALNPLQLLSAQAAALARPGRYFATLALALRLRAPGLRALLYQMIYFAEATVLARHLRTQKVTHLHGHFANACASVAMLAAHLTDLPFSFTLHGPSDLQEPRLWRLDEKIARARFVACISHFARSQAMLNADPAHWEKLKIVHCGVLPELYDRPVSESGEAGTLHLAFVGRLAPVKGLRVLLDAMGPLLEARPGLRLTIVGDGPDRAALETLARPLGEAVRFTGVLSQDEVAATLADADALVLPSFAEGVPVVLMEAMASGKPVIATRVAGVQELVEDGISGFVVPPGDADALARSIKALAADPALRRAMGQAGQAKVRAEFDIDAEAVRLKRLFGGALDGGPRPPVN